MGEAAIAVSVILVVLAALAVLLVLRAVLLKPTPARAAEINPDNSERATVYGRRLSMMIQKETVSSRYDGSMSHFQETLMRKDGYGVEEPWILRQACLWEWTFIKE